VPAEEKSPEVADPPTPEARMREQLIVVEQMVAQGLKKEALAELRSLAAEDRFDPQGFYNVANAFARLDATDDAIHTYRKAINQRNGKYSRASNNLGVVLLRQGFWDQAYEAFVQALRVENFHYAEASYNLGRLYAARGEMDLAVREWRRAVKVDPKHYEAARALSGASSTSRSTPEPTVAPQPISSPAASVRTQTPARTETTSARTPSTASFTLDTESHELLQRARTDHEHGRYEQAVNGFRRVIARNGGFFGPANLELSYSLIELRRNDEAIAELQRVAEKDGARFPISYYHLARLYEQRGDLQAAELNYLRATQSYKTENAQFLLNLSTVRDKRGDFAGALVAMENYVKRKEQLGQRPDWADARLKELREKAAAKTQ
jgi:tetratricopeptide (TPR) repeat protein